MSFARPDEWHAPATYWFWQRIPTREEIRDQLDALAAAGFGSFQIQTRLSFPREEYLGEEYLAACRTVADEAASRGLMMGLYDEYNWLSGHAGGRTVAGRDDLRERHMFSVTARPEGAFAECAVDGIRATDVDYLLDPGRNWVFEDGAIRWDEWEIVAALAHPDGVVDGPESIMDVTADAVLVEAGTSGCRVRVAAEALRGQSALTVFAAARCASSRMINYLLPGAAERFLDVGYEPYAAALGDHLGSTVRYVFFDQPHGCFFDWRGRSGHVGSSLMYAPSVVPADRRVLLALARDVGPLTAAWRCDFFERYAAVGIDAFFGTLSAWCRAHGVALSGHEVLGYVSSWDPTSTIITDDPRVNFGTDYFGLDAHRDLTAVDARNEHPQISAKFGDSMARSHGRSGCLVEQYFARTEHGSHFAAGRWELTLGQLREQTVRHHLLGMRQLLTHAFWLADGDERDEVFTNPRFDFPPGVNFEPWFVHHRAFAEESGRLSEFLDETRPMDEIALLYPLRTSWAGGPGHPYGEHLAFWAEHLARRGYDFSLVDERDLLGGRLPERFTVLILPGASVVAGETTVDAIDEFAARGGSVLASGPLPAATQRTGLSGRVLDRMRALLAPERGAGAYWPDLPTGAEADARLGAALAGHTRVEAEGTVWSRRGRDATGTRVALFNDDPGRRTVSVRPTGLPARVTVWNTADGTIGEPYEVPGELVLTLDPGELVCVHVAPGPHPVPATRVLDREWTLAAGDRVGPVDVYRGWERQGEEAFSGIGEYRTEVVLTAAEAAWPRWELLLDGVGASAEAEINGHPVGRWGWGPFRAAFGPDVLREGPNLLRIRVASTAANAYYAGSSHRQGPPDPSGLLSPPRLRPHLG
ncbi:hypothetical protein [Streptomyces sp. TS71-3]|uniref:hypothetical protein n=1 Tax=Streptomyces sp. TS71-3 TaxID=2733862 RepID=UPI001B2DBE58|nr:hypothetical protein [Streptomyces sp. TS71-3]GHJ36977.1 hypothetical protein Sm713_25860 [Streptomyces sp. TS71-3]